VDNKIKKKKSRIKVINWERRGEEDATKKNA
jgi:hypothetical protein